MVSVQNAASPPLRVSDPLAEIVRDMGELMRQYVASLNEKIRTLEERVTDLEGHAEHAPAETCGICAPDDEPETVGADAYARVNTADSETTCQNPHCGEPINPGDSVIKVGEGMYVHDYC